MDKIPDHLISDYTQGGIIPISYWWFDPRAEKNKNQRQLWDNNVMTHFLKKYAPNRLRKELGPYDGACVNIQEALNRFKIHDKTLAIIGSAKPWIEAIALNCNNVVTTVEYNEPASTYPNLTTENYFNFEKNQEKRYDCIITFSSVEHSGLGRYGDPLDPLGDIKTMTAIRNSLKDDGVLIWGAPVGLDTLVWNAHRVYGEKRLPLLFAGFKKVDYIFDRSYESIINIPPVNKKGTFSQPVIILKKQIL